MVITLYQEEEHGKTYTYEEAFKANINALKQHELNTVEIKRLYPILEQCTPPNEETRVVLRGLPDMRIIIMKSPNFDEELYRAETAL